MKNSLLYIVILAVCALSCKKNYSKEDEAIQRDKMYKIDISTSGITEIITNSLVNTPNANGSVVNSTSEINGYLKKLYYTVFDSNGKRIHFIQQDSTSSGFGSITDSLAAGTYNIQIAAGKNQLNYLTNYNSVVTPGTTANGVLAQLSYGEPSNLLPVWGDTFLGKLQLTVKDNLNQNIVLNRIVGKLQVALLDTIPARANKLVVLIYQEATVYDIPKEIPMNMRLYRGTIIIPAASKNKPNFIAEYMVGNTVIPTKVGIEIYDATEKLIASTLVNDVSFQKNKTTILSGKIFGANDRFNIKLNPWGSAINIPF